MATPTPSTTTAPELKPSRNGHVGATEKSAPHLVMLVQPQSPAAEAYRTLRVNIQFSSVDQRVQMLAVTSAQAGEGKTTTVANLAIAMAEAGAHVIAVDADLRRPALHTAFGLDNDAGLTTAVFSDGEELPLHDTPVPGLRVLTSGPLPPNPGELVSSKRMERILAGLRTQADVIVLDTPPAAALSDAATLATRSDGVILVVGAGRTRRDHARRAKEQLERVHARILGVVLTGVRADESLYTY